MSKNYYFATDEELAGETIRVSNEIINSIITNKDDFIKDVLREVESEALNYELCKNCGEELELIGSYLERREYFGSECYEEVYEVGCTNCC